ncbi:hypothetical protein [Microbacterium sp. SS28]|uniref:hypothetical protein n=1 Tax=Microbacterium sp. SS28 TaxID=2919948 RepID=UPI001FA94487|nr:hypothetical protein [Microbacterium sp. SS28]
MPHRSTSSFGLTELVAAAFSLPLMSLFIALIVGGVILVIRSRPGGAGSRAARSSEAVARSVRARYVPEHRAAGITAIAVVVLFTVDNVVRGYLIVAPDLVAWWRFATPVVCAAVGLGVALALIRTRGTTAPEAPVVPTARRTWLSFSRRGAVIGAGIALLALTATTITAGLASSADGEGRHVWLVIPAPNEAQIDPIRVGFYGWAYGVPVLIGLAALSALTWAVLHANAARPYLRPETVAAERDARREVAAAAVAIATATMLLALAGAWRLIARAGSVSQLTITGSDAPAPYEVAWRYAELAVAAGWLAPILEVTAFVLLMLVASRLWRGSSDAAPAREAWLGSRAEATR